MNNFGTRLAKLEQKKAQDEPIQWQVSIVEKNEQGEIVVVGRHWYYADGSKGLAKG